MWHIILYVLAALVGICIVFCVAPGFVVFNTVFHRRTNVGRDKAYYRPYRPMIDAALERLAAMPLTEMSLTAADGTVLRADYYDRGCDRTAILFHGYRATPYTNCPYQATLLADAGYNILLVHQRAHGKSDGAYTTMGYFEGGDSLGWIDRVAAMPHIRHIVLYGVSMGAVALGYASDRIPREKVRAMILDCGYSGIDDQMKTDARKMHVPPEPLFSVVRLLFRIRFGGDTHAKVADSLGKTAIPALFLHGTADGSVPVEHGKVNFAACLSEKEAIYVPDADHTCAILAGGDHVRAAVLAFLDRYVTDQNKHEGENP